MVWVESGEIEAHFDLSGVSLTLRQHDLIHFYAEHRHRVVAKKPSTKLFIIRFYQIGSEKTRQFLWRALEGLLDRTEDTKYEAVRNEARAWIHEISPSYRKEGRNVQDVLGLARFLTRWKDFRPEPSTARIDQETKSKLESARLAPKDHISLADVAADYGMEGFLLHSYKARAVPGMIVLRDNSRDFEPASGLFPGEKGEVALSLPIRNLSCADMSLARVALQRGGTWASTGIRDTKRSS